MKANLANKITSFIGSWKFIIGQSIFLVMYITYNLLSSEPFDPFPFIFLNLLLSFQAAYTAPIILMSHALMNSRDRDLAEQNQHNTLQILDMLSKVEHKLIKEVDEAVIEITDAIESDEDESRSESNTEDKTHG